MYYAKIISNTRSHNWGGLIVVLIAQAQEGGDPWASVDDGAGLQQGFQGGVSSEEEAARKAQAEEAIKAYQLAEYWSKKAAGPEPEPQPAAPAEPAP